MKNKLLVFAFVCAMLGLMGCRNEKTDIFEVSTQIAQNTLQGTYVYIDVDSTKMSTTLQEWKLTENATDGKTGYYRIASTGCGEDSDLQTPLSWEPATMTENHQTMIIPVKIGDEDMKLNWTGGVLDFGEYATFKSLISIADLLLNFREKFANVTFVFNDTTPYLTVDRDTIPYLAWKTEVVNFTQDSIDWYKQFLLDMADTLAWFNATYPMQAVPDTVRFSTNQQANGTYKGQISRPYETTRIEADTTNHGPLEIINGELICERQSAQVGVENNGSFSFRQRTWTKEFYDSPASPKAQSYDSLFEISNAKWTMTSFTNAKKFDVLFKGNTIIKVAATEAGNDTRDGKPQEANNFTLLQFSAYNADEGVVMLFDKKFTLKK